jgi:hypothetical protein
MTTHLPYAASGLPMRPSFNCRVRPAIQQYGENERWRIVLLEGISGIVLCVLTCLWPGTTATALLAFIAAGAIVMGALEIAAAIGLRKVIQGEWTLILAGAASALFGVLLVPPVSWEPSGRYPGCDTRTSSTNGKGFHNRLLNAWEVDCDGGALARRAVDSVGGAARPSKKTPS